LLKSWDHSLKWAEVLLNDYFQMTKDKSIKALLAKQVFALGGRRARSLAKMCENKYDYDLPAMIEYLRNDRIEMLPKPVQTAYNVFNLLFGIQ